jgi:hypothetical protein
MTSRAQTAVLAAAFLFSPAISACSSPGEVPPSLDRDGGARTDAVIDGAEDAPADGGGFTDTGGSETNAESQPLPVFAMEAPDSTSPGGTTFFNNFAQFVLPHIAGPGFTVPWSAVDDCSSTEPCSSEGAYDWSAIDQNIMNYVRNTVTPFDVGCGGHACKSILIVQSTTDSGNVNSATPQYVFGQEWAASVGAENPQDVMICNNVQGGTIQAGGARFAPPITSGANWSKPEYATWNVQSGTLLSTPTDLSITGTFPTANFSGFPVAYEKPFLAAYEHFIHDLLIHYSSAGTGDGPTIAPFVAYIRFGVSEGGENVQECGAAGDLQYSPWSPLTQYPAGYLVRPPSSVNPGNFVFVSGGSGKTSESGPHWCQTAYCNTTEDGSVPAWRNTGAAPNEGAAASAMWPGILGQSKEPHGFTYNGYLSAWENGDGTGYVSELTGFIAAQGSKIPTDISSHNGVPFNQNWTLADGEAVLAAGAGIGFGMEALSLGDVILDGENAVPSSSSNWIENFAVFATAPIVRHLQTEWPGGGVPGTQSEAFAITDIAVDSAGTATVHCATGCQTFCGSETDGGIVYVNGNSNGALNAPWHGVTCQGDEPTFSAGSSVKAGTYAAGAIYSTDYLPVTMPFARAHHATSIELHECSFDYAFGTETSSRCTGSKGPDSSYQAALAGK